MLKILILLVLVLLQGTLLSQVSGETWKVEVEGLSCPLCSKNIYKQVKRIPGVGEVVTDLGTGIITVRFVQGSQGNKEMIVKAIEAAGFTVARAAKEE